jgi:hypothetical protein
MVANREAFTPRPGRPDQAHATSSEDDAAHRRAARDPRPAGLTLTGRQTGPGAGRPIPGRGGFPSIGTHGLPPAAGGSGGHDLLPPVDLRRGRSRARFREVGQGLAAGAPARRGLRFRIQSPQLCHDRARRALPGPPASLHPDLPGGAPRAGATSEFAPLAVRARRGGRPALASRHGAVLAHPGRGLFSGGFGRAPGMGRCDRRQHRRVHCGVRRHPGGGGAPGGAIASAYATGPDRTGACPPHGRRLHRCSRVGRSTRLGRRHPCLWRRQPPSLAARPRHSRTRDRLRGGRDRLPCAQLPGWWRGGEAPDPLEHWRC